jgi:hypothetical protein
LDDASYRTQLTQSAVTEGLADIIPEIIGVLDKTLWQGRIAKVAGPKLYVNAGRASGLMTGDILKVVGTGEDIFDPVTGAYLGRSPGQLKGTLELVEFVGQDGALTHIHTGGNFQEGDLVQLY